MADARSVGPHHVLLRRDVLNAAERHLRVLLHIQPLAVGPQRALELHRRVIGAAAHIAQEAPAPIPAPHASASHISQEGGVKAGWCGTAF